MNWRAMLAAILLLVLAGCGGGASPSGGQPSGPATPAPTGVVATAPAETPGPTPGPESPVPAGRCPEVPEPTGTLCYTITIRDFAFDPPVLTVPTSARIVFLNEDGSAHSIAWADGTPTSPTLAPGDSTERTFSAAAPATLDYTCGIHGARMSGRIVLDASLPVP